jgi:hypothetical protein
MPAHSRILYVWECFGALHLIVIGLFYFYKYCTALPLFLLKCKAQDIKLLTHNKNQCHDFTGYYKNLKAGYPLFLRKQIG